MTLRELREQSGKSRAEVAAALGVAVRTLAHYENGTRWLKPEQILVLSSIFDESAEEVIIAQINSRQCARSDNLP